MLVIGTIAAAVTLTGCGGSSGSGERSVSGVRDCLENAGYGITTVPTSQVTGFGPENRGKGQTGELLVGLDGARPPVGADDADAVVAFFDSAKHASSAPGTKTSNPVLHVVAIGSVTVQGTSHLAEAVIKQGGRGANALTAFNGQLKKIEGCV